MSHEAKIHPAQVSILRELLFHPAAGFAELQKPTGLDSDHFKFHIKRLVELEYVKKQEDGSYALTTKGKEYGNRLDTDDHTIEKQPKSSVLLLAVRGDVDDLEVLVQQRLKHPFYGYWCRAGGKIRWGETVVQAAHRELMEEMGVTADIEIKGVYHKIDRRNEDGELLEDKLFYMAVCTNIQGELIQEFEGGRNAWMKISEIKKQPKVFEGVTEGIDNYLGEQFHFEERTHWYNGKEY